MSFLLGSSYRQALSAVEVLGNRERWLLAHLCQYTNNNNDDDVAIILRQDNGLGM